VIGLLLASGAGAEAFTPQRLAAAPRPTRDIVRRALALRVDRELLAKRTLAEVEASALGEAFPRELTRLVVEVLFGMDGCAPSSPPPSFSLPRQCSRFRALARVDATPTGCARSRRRWTRS
jgi:hypothetical protein